MKAKIRYDEEVDILVLSKVKKIKYSHSVGNFVFDIDFKGLICGVEILDASDTLSMKEEDLKNLTEASMIITYKPNNVHVVLVLKGVEKEIEVPLQISGKATEKVSFAA